MEWYIFPIDIINYSFPNIKFKDTKSFIYYNRNDCQSHKNTGFK